MIASLTEHWNRKQKRIKAKQKTCKNWKKGIFM